MGARQRSLAWYPEPFFEPFTTLSWLAGITTRVLLGTTVIVLPYRHPLLTARMAQTLDQLSGGRLVLGVGTGGARQEFEALGVPYARRGKLTDQYLAVQASAAINHRLSRRQQRSGDEAGHQVQRRLAPAARHPALPAR